jgi:hypothetical protein
MPLNGTDSLQDDSPKKAVTIRETVTRKKRWIMLIMFSGFGIFVGGMPLALLIDPAFISVSFSGFAVTFITMLYAELFGLPCPSCGGNWAPLALHSRSGPFSLNRRIHYCPFCGCNIDTELTEKSQEL